MAAACRKFPHHESRWESTLDGANVMASPNSYFYREAGCNRADSQ
jgi:hypothetical protein